jgi:predicted NAD-dependent protein-ADP-ribosyltransferase YbiA (DUF1768 family)
MDNIEHCSTENYFQCAKCLDKKDFEIVLASGAGESAWSAGSKVKIKKDWDVIKVRKMYEGNKAKYEQNEKLKNILISTKGDIVFKEGSGFWNMWNGKIHMLIREQLKEKDKKNDIIEQILKSILDYEEQQKKLIK